MKQYRFCWESKRGSKGKGDWQDDDGRSNIWKLSADKSPRIKEAWVEWREVASA